MNSNNIMMPRVISLYVICLYIGTLSCNRSMIKQEVSPLTISKDVDISYPSNLKTLQQNIINYYLEIKPDSNQVEKLLNELKVDGSWPSIDYTNRVRGGWPVKIHLEHVQKLAIVYNAKESVYYHDKKISEKIHLALNYWLDNDFLSTNWWDQHIGVPEFLGPTLILMENELSQQQLDQGLVLMRRAKIKMTGQNKVWLSGNVLMRSLLVRDADSVLMASKSIQDELQISTGVGIKADWSYHEHGAQLQFGNYGLSFLEDMIKWYTILNDTPYQFSDTKIEVLRNFILKGQQWILWDEKMDVSASGRQLYPNAQTIKYERLKDCIQKMEAIDLANKEEYNKAWNSKVLSGNKHFWKSDFHVHRRPDFYFSVKMSSDRVIGTESVNQENVQGYYLGDGASLLYANGGEYQDIFPFWDWKKVPGTTIIQDDSPLPIIKFSDFITNSTFVGGVTDGQNGISVLGYDRDGLKANKSWFMIDDKIVCLGNGINAKTDFPVTTSINQVFLKGNITISKDNKVVKKTRSKQSLFADWLLHDGTGYIFPSGESINIETRFLEGSWNKVIKRYRPVILTESILRMWFDHGPNPNEEMYSYILVPDASIQEMERLHENPPFTIVNNKSQQSVTTKDGKTVGMVFYKAGKTAVFGGVEVDQACVLLIEKNKNELKLNVSDPSQTLQNIQMTISGNYESQFSNIGNNQTVLDLSLPVGENAGSTVSVILKKAL